MATLKHCLELALKLAESRPATEIGHLNEADAKELVSAAETLRSDSDLSRKDSQAQAVRMAIVETQKLLDGLPGQQAPVTVQGAKAFQPDDIVIMHSPHTGDDIEVSYRGPLGADKSVVWTGKTQMAVPTEWLRPKAKELAPSFAPPDRPVLPNMKAGTEEQKDAAFKTYIASVTKYNNDVKAWEASLPQNERLIFTSGNLLYLVTKDPKGGWRSTTVSVSDKMPMGHEEYKTRLEALKQVVAGHDVERLDKVPFAIEPLPPRTDPALAPAPEPVAKAQEQVREQQKPVEPMKAKAQKKFLLAEIKKAVADAPDNVENESNTAQELKLLRSRVPPAGETWDGFVERLILEHHPESTALGALEGPMQRLVDQGSQHVTIEVPGDGTFSIINSKTALKAFEERAKRFPTTEAKAPEQKLPNAESKALPTLKENPTVADKEKAVALVASDDETRIELNYIYSDGKQIVASDGRRVVILEAKGRGTEKNPVLIHAKTGAVEKNGFDYVQTVTKNGKETKETIQIEYPNFKQVIPESSILRAKSVDTGQLISLLRQAKGVLDKYGNVGGDVTSVYLYVDEHGAIGIEAKNPNVGEYRTGTFNETSKATALNPDYLLDILAIARRTGHEKVSISFADELSPIILEATGFKAALMLMRMSSLLPSGQAEARYNFATGEAEVSASTPESRHAAMVWHEIVTHGGIQAEARKDTEGGAQMRKAIAASADSLLAEADAIARDGGFRDAAHLIESYQKHDPTFGDGSEDGQRKYIVELMARFAERMVGKDRPSWWRDLLGRIQVWFAKRFGVKLSLNGVEALLRATQRDVAGKKLRVVADLGQDGETDVSFFLNPLPLNLLDPSLRPEDRKKEFAYSAMSNLLPTRFITAAFNALPKNVQTVLSNVKVSLGHIKEAAAELGGNLPQGATMREMAASISNDPHDQSRAIMETAGVVFKIRESRDNQSNVLMDKTKVLDAMVAREAGKDHAIELAADMLNEQRQLLAAQLALSKKIGDSIGVSGAIAQMKELADLESAVSIVMKATAKQMGPLLADPNLTKEDVVSWMQANAASLPQGKLAVVIQLASQQADTVQRLRVMANLAESPDLAAARADWNKNRQALDFLAAWVDAPEQRALELEARDFLSMNENIERLHQSTGEHWFANPFDPEQHFTISADLDQETWEENSRKFNDIRGWYESYLDPDNDVNDVVKQAGVQQMLRLLDTMQIQHNAPNLGKIAPGRFNLFGTLARVKATSDYVTEIIGGRLAHLMDIAFANIANVRDRINNVIQTHLYPMQRIVIQAARAAGYTGSDNQVVEMWNKKIGERIFEKGQARGDVRKQVGEKVLGHVITQLDMRAVKAQKEFANTLLDAAQSVTDGQEATVGGRVFLVRVLDKIGNKIIQRKAQDTTGLTMPQRPSGVDLFTAEWKKGDKNKETLVNMPEFWSKVLSHIRGYSAAEYLAQNPTPFLREYRQIEADSNETGVEPETLDQLAKIIFAKTVENGGETLDIDAIKKQVLKEINLDVNLWETNWANEPTISGTEPSVNVVSAENFMNRPRGERIMPPGFYSYTVASAESVAGLRKAAQEIYTHELLRIGKQLEKALLAKQEAINGEIGKGRASDKTSKQELVDGKTLVHYREIERVRPMLTKLIAEWEAEAEKAKKTDARLYSGPRTFIGWVINSLLSKVDALYRNFSGGPQNVAQMNMETRPEIGIIRRIPLIHPLYASARAQLAQGMATVANVSAVISGTKKGRELSKFIHQNSWVPDFIGALQMGIDRKLARYDEMKRLGLVAENPVFGDVRKNWEMWKQMGQLTRDLETPSAVRTALRASGSMVEIMLDTGLVGLPIPPKALGAKAVDNAINAAADRHLQDELDTLHTNSMASLNVRATLGLDPINAVLTPEEVFGLTGKSSYANKRVLAALRSIWAKSGISLDRYLIEYWQAVQEAKAKGTDPSKVDVLTRAQRNSLLFTLASRINKGGPHNRPLWGTPEANMASSLMGYGIWQNGRMAIAISKHSGDPRIISLDDAKRVMNLVALIGITGALAYPIIRWLVGLYKEEKPVKSLLDTTSVGDFLTTTLRQSYANLPVIGQTLNYVLGEVRPGSAMSAGGFSLLPVSMMTSIADAIGRVAQTGDILAPSLNLMRQWVPNTRIWINRLDVREGLANEGAMRAIIAANVPNTMEVKPYNSAQARRYSVISSEVESIRNAISQDGSPDMAKANEKRTAAIAKLEALGHSPKEAAKMVDSAVLASDPFRTITGRDPTTTERAHILGQLSASQRGVFASVEGGRQAYAQAFGRPVPDFTTTRGPAVEAEAVRLGLPSPAAERAAASRSGRGGTRISRGRTMRVAVPRTSRSRGLSLTRGTVTPVRASRTARTTRFRLARTSGGRVRSTRNARSRRTRAKVTA